MLSYSSSQTRTSGLPGGGLGGAGKKPLRGAAIGARPRYSVGCSGGSRARQRGAQLGREQEAGGMARGGRARQQPAEQDQLLAEALGRAVVGDHGPGT